MRPEVWKRSSPASRQFSRHSFGLAGRSPARRVFELPYRVEEVFGEVGVDLENVVALRIRDVVDVRLDRDEALEFRFLLFGPPPLLAVEDAAVDEVLEDVVDVPRVDVKPLDRKSVV